MRSKRSPRDGHEGPTLAFDVTQEIDPALAEDLRDSGEQTLTQTDFEDVTLVLPEKKKPRP
jgi:hypothetical protein